MRRPLEPAGEKPGHRHLPAFFPPAILPQGAYATAMSVELDSAHALAVQNVFGGHRLVAVQKARIAALKAAGLAAGVTSDYSKSWNEDSGSWKRMSESSDRHADVSAKL